MLRRGLRAGRRSGRIATRRDLRYFAFDYWRRFVLKQDASSTPPAAFIPLVAAVPSAPGCGAVIEVRLAGGASLLWPDGRALSELAKLLHLLAV